MSIVTAPLPWQQDQWRGLMELLASGRLPHALMLAGPSETGKSAFAEILAQRLLCEVPDELGYPCGQCKNCQLFRSGSHPDYYRLNPDEQGKAIRIDHVRELGAFANKTASLGGWRTVVVNPAEAMNTSAANAFLKTLEEPGSDTLIILVCHRPSAVLPTIRSRCRSLTFPLPDREALRAWLSARESGRTPDPDIVALAGGKPLRALRFLESDLLDQYRHFEGILEQLANRQSTPLEAARQMQSLPEGDAIDWFQQRLYAIIRERQTLQALETRRFFRLLDRLNRARSLLQSTANPNRQLLWEEVLLDWMSVVNLRPGTAPRRR